MKKSLLALIVILLLSINMIDAKPDVSATKVDPAFEQFWKDFQAAVAKGDKGKIVEMTNFPLVELSDVGSGGSSYWETNLKGFNEFTFNNYFTNSTIKKKIASTTADKFKSGKIQSKDLTDDNGKAVGQGLKDGMPTYNLKIGTRPYSVFIFGLVNGIYKLIWLEYNNPE